MNRIAVSPGLPWRRTGRRKPPWLRSAPQQMRQWKPQHLPLVPAGQNMLAGRPLPRDNGWMARTPRPAEPHHAHYLPSARSPCHG